MRHVFVLLLVLVCGLAWSTGFGAESAAPIARDIVKAYYDKKQGKPLQPLVTQSSPAGTVGAPQPVIAQAQPVNKSEPPIEGFAPSQASR